MSALQILDFVEYAEQGQRLISMLNAPYVEVQSHTFPDDERKLHLSVPLAKHVLFCHSLNSPDHRLIGLLPAEAFDTVITVDATYVA